MSDKESREADEWDDVDCTVRTVYDSSEYALLEELQDVFGELMDIAADGEDSDEGFLVGFNSRSFDHTYLGARFARKRLDGWPLTYGAKRLDMQRVCNGERQFGSYPSQDDVAKELGLDVPDEYDGSDMPELIEDGLYEEVASHAQADVEELCQIFFELREEGMEEFYDHYDIEKDANYVREVDF